MTNSLGELHEATKRNASFISIIPIGSHAADGHRLDTRVAELLTRSTIVTETSAAAVVVTSALTVIERRDQRWRDSALRRIDNVTLSIHL
ncbi:hypothetical protein [Rhodococcoides fascians]|uniref:hypothetical protein n=1 Tax=Rhodococcoides fascians TaxID=1828 RepID=UPI001179CC7E|nr:MULTISPECIES: hypothetical protein [Rhodococcus]